MELSSLGTFFQGFALIVCLASIALYGYSYSTKQEKYYSYASYAFLGTGLLIVLASIVLLIALVISDFSIKYVANYSDNSLPMFYKVSAFWGGQSGSLLLWTLLLVIFGTIEIFRLKGYNNQKEAEGGLALNYKLGVMLVLAITTLFFIAMVTFFQNPFEPARVIPRDGQGLNPLLQNPGMVIHPPTLYIGYVGFTVIIAHAIASILAKDFSSFWLKFARPWSIVIWMFLTVGIVIGGWWAYVELGWGGYWAWDPVENASIMPWFTATAFLHTAYVYEKKNSLKLWAYILILISFELTILGTYITRSGAIQSVHAFGPNAIGTYFLIFIALSTVAYLLILFLSDGYKNILKKEAKQPINFLSREGLVFISNWIFIAITIAIIFGTVSPAFTEWTFEVSYFNRATKPFFLVLFLAAGFGLLTSFKISDIKKHYLKIAGCLLASLIFAIILLLLGYNIVWALLLSFAIFFMFSACIYRLFELFSKGGFKSIFSANRYFGAILVHIGLAVLSFGIVMSAYYKYEEILTANNGSTFLFNPKENQIAVLDGDVADSRQAYLEAAKSAFDSMVAQGIDTKNIEEPKLPSTVYKFIIHSYETTQENNYISAYVPIKIFKNDKLVTEVFPEIREYKSHRDNIFREVAYISLLSGDIYFTFYIVNEDESMSIPFYYHPFVSWIWFGCIIMCLAAIYGVIRFKPTTAS